MSDEHPKLEDFRLVRRTEPDRDAYYLAQMAELSAKLTAMRTALLAWKKARGNSPAVWTPEELAARAPDDPIRLYQEAVALADEALKGET